MEYLVLPPYEFTLLSNSNTTDDFDGDVLPPYEFTLLSNLGYKIALNRRVLPPYEFTLLSNDSLMLYGACPCFTTI